MPIIGLNLGLIKRTTLPLLLLLYLAATALAFAGQQENVTMWRIDGQKNRIYLLGSIHLLRKSDYPIPSVIYEAYDDAESLIMELDMDDADPLATQALIQELGFSNDGRTLRQQLGEVNYAKAAAYAEDLEISLDMFSGSKPWLAAVTVEVLLLSRLGFDPMQGIEMHLTERAARDGKEILGLETERQQFEVLAGLSPEMQAQMLLQILSDGESIGELLDGTVVAWRRGDTAYLDAAMLRDLESLPELHEALIVERNNNWLSQIDALLDDEDDYLIVVGALHLIGENGVPALLKNRGLSIQQMHQSN